MNSGFSGYSSREHTFLGNYPPRAHGCPSSRFTLGLRRLCLIGMLNHQAKIIIRGTNRIITKSLPVPFV